MSICAEFCARREAIWCRSTMAESSREARLKRAGFQKHVTAAEWTRGALDMMPVLEEAEIVETWAGLRPGTPDDLPIIGPTEIEGLRSHGPLSQWHSSGSGDCWSVREWITRGLAARYGKGGKFSPLRFRRSGAAAGRF